jgi:hypothetical protein
MASAAVLIVRALAKVIGRKFSSLARTFPERSSEIDRDAARLAQTVK